MRVSPIITSNYGLLSAKKVSNTNNSCRICDPTKPEGTQCPSFSSKGAVTTLFTLAGLALAGPFGALASGIVGCAADNWLNNDSNSSSQGSSDPRDEFTHLEPDPYRLGTTDTY